MWTESQTIIESCENLNIDCEKLSNLKFFKPNILEFFSDGVIFGGDLKDAKWVSIGGSIEILKTYALSEKHIIFFDESNDKSALVFDDISDVIRAVYESPRMDFFIADIEFKYIIYYNRHDRLGLSGISKDWLPSIEFNLR